MTGVSNEWLRFIQMNQETKKGKVEEKEKIKTKKEAPVKKA